MGSVFGLFQLLQQGWAAYKEQKFISHGSGRSKIKAPVGSSKGPLPGSKLIPLAVEEQESSAVSLLRALLILFVRALPHDLSTSQRPVKSGVRFQPVNLRDTNIQGSIRL